jgi:apolipoprotein N-acyltransferase
VNNSQFQRSKNWLLQNSLRGLLALGAAIIAVTANWIAITFRDVPIIVSVLLGWAILGGVLVCVVSFLLSLFLDRSRWTAILGVVVVTSVFWDFLPLLAILGAYLGLALWPTVLLLAIATAIFLFYRRRSAQSKTLPSGRADHPPS